MYSYVALKYKFDKQRSPYCEEHGADAGVDRQMEEGSSEGGGNGQEEDGGEGEK